MAGVGYTALLKGKNAMLLKRVRNCLCKKSVGLLVILILYALEKSIAVKLGAKEMKKSPSPQSELK